MALSPAAKAKHQEFLVGQFSRDVYVVTEWRDDSVWKTKKIGTVVAFVNSPPFKPGSHARLVPTTR